MNIYLRSDRARVRDQYSEVISLEERDRYVQWWEEELHRLIYTAGVGVEEAVWPRQL